ncbi:MAG: NAD-dependent epimerase/dehydratase family protein [Bacteroidia bacterium]
MAEKETILVIGANGQIGVELVERLRSIYGNDGVVASDVVKPIKNSSDGIFEVLDVLNIKNLDEVVSRHKITQVYLLAALLSATAERNPKLGWQLNMEGLINLLDLAKEERIKKLYWPSSIAVFGPNTPKDNTPQYGVMEPSTVYGISKLAGERWCEYYFHKYRVDVRSLRYPGLIGYKSAPGGGTTDYAVHIFHEALKNKRYECFLSENTTLPMMYMPDAIDATINIMDAPAEKLIIRSSYNIGAMSFSPKQIAFELKKHIPEFEISYEPDARQLIADSWPRSINDKPARNDWGWIPKYDLSKMTKDMLDHLKKVS